MVLLSVFVTGNAAAQLPVYLDNTKSIELRVEDALKRMTLTEKIAVIHAQSKFSSPGVKRLGIPDFWTDDGPHGVRPDVLWDQWNRQGTPMTHVLPFLRLPVLLHHGILIWLLSTEIVWERKPSIVGKT